MVVAVDVAVDDAVDVGVVVSVVVVVGVDVGVVVVVGVVVAVVLVVTDVVGVEVGVVISQSSKPPLTTASAIAFNVAATASQAECGAVNAAPVHPTTIASPAGPRYSVPAALIAAAASAQVAASALRSLTFVNTSSTPSCISQATSTLLLDSRRGRLSATLV